MSPITFLPIGVLLLISGTWLASRGRKVGYFFALVAIVSIISAFTKTHMIS